MQGTLLSSCTVRPSTMENWERIRSRLAVRKSLNVLQELGGWESAEMVRRHAHLSTVHLADYVNRRQALSDVSVTVNKKVLNISD